MMKMVILAGVVLALAVSMVFVVGALLPQGHVVARSIVVKQPREAVFALISDIAAAPSWRSDVKSVERIEAPERETFYREHSADGALTLRVTESVPPRRFVTVIADAGLPYGGSWIFELREETGRTRLTITERGEVYNVVFRFMAKFVFGHDKTLNTYLANVAKKFGETPVIEESGPAE